jgi:LEA14-like dessication related protein
MNELRSAWRSWLVAALLLGLAGCAAWPGSDPLRVSLAGIEPLPAEGMEVRMAVKLRIQNPNDAPVNFDGVALTLELRGLDFASGVSDAQGSVPRFGESLLVVPVTVSAFAMARQVYTFAMGDRSKVTFVARGRLAGGGFGGVRFESKGEFELPAGLAQPPATPAPAAN